MNFYYNKSMGNGTITGKFRLNPITASVQSNQSNLRSEIVPKVDPPANSVQNPVQKSPEPSQTTTTNTDVKFIYNKEVPAEPNQVIGTHHSSNCNRCYRLKKKCSREYPKCSNCVRTTSECEYINRTNKRRKRTKPGEAEPVESVVANKLVSVSSLLSSESETQVIPTPSTTSSESEFITMKAIYDDLPLIFVLNYFENYSYRYPFINRTDFLSAFKKIEFSKETILNLDVYLLMSIGCLIYDSKCNTKYYNEYFKEKNIESIVNGVDAKFDIENLKLLLLLTIHAITSVNRDLCWNLIGVLNRAVIKWDMYTSKDLLQQRIVWTIHNLDKEISLLLRKPSQFPSYEYLQVEYPLTVKLYGEESLPLVNKNIELSKLKQAILHLNLTKSKSDLHELSGELEKWRISSSKVIHQSSDISDLISWINMQYYYLLIELDQVSDSQSFQFTLQYLSNSFTLLISSSDRQKSNTKLSITSNLFWFIQLFNVIKFNIMSLRHLIETNDQMRLEEFNSNLLLILNLLKYLKVNFAINHSISLLVEARIAKLTELSLELMKVNESGKKNLLERIAKIETSV